jgi:hypothetical protein
MTELPPDARDRYERHGLAAALSSVAYYRALDESTAERVYFEHSDEQTRWMWEAVPADTQFVAIRQLEIPGDGPARRYWWRSLEDDAGGLTDQPLNPEQEELTAITRQQFYELWNRGNADE